MGHPVVFLSAQGDRSLEGSAPSLTLTLPIAGDASPSTKQCPVSKYPCAADGAWRSLPAPSMFIKMRRRGPRGEACDRAGRGAF
jgi:hypothetical protein